jgi:pimeloyl-ACP methyl ester carboxylesterase
VGLLDALGYEQTMLGAQDMGARVAWRLVTSHADRIERFAVIDFGHPYGYETETDQETVSWYRTFLQIPWLPGYTARLGNWSVLTSSLRDSSADGAFPEHEMEQFRSAWDRDGAIHTMGTWYRGAFDPLEGDGRVSTPTLVIQAKNDAFIPTDLSEVGMQYLDNGERLELGSGTHWVAGEEPERIGQILVDFFTPEPVASAEPPPGAETPVE